MSRFSIDQIEEAYQRIDGVFLHTPQYVCDSLSDQLKVNVIVKVETLNPIRSFKGRGADLLVHGATTDHLICASAGNFGQAMAYAARKKRIHLTVYASTNANPYKVDRMRAMGAEVILKGNDFDEAKVEARLAATQSGIRFVEDSLDVETVIGAGTIGLELKEYTDTLDAVLVPLGNGALINGISCALKHHRPEVKVIAVQSAGAPAMINSWRKGKAMEEPANTIADGIGVRLPVPEALKDMNGFVDEGLLVKEETIIKAMKLIHEHVGILVEPSAAVGVAALLENESTFKGKSTGVILCGSNLTHEQIKKWI